MRSFVHACRSPPGYLRALARRGTFFVRKPPTGVAKKSIPRLLEQVRHCSRCACCAAPHLDVRCCAVLYRAVR